jgi:hypothetical protein
MEELLVIFGRVSEKEPRWSSIWDTLAIGKGTWILTATSAPATSLRGSMCWGWGWNLELVRGGEGEELGVNREERSKVKKKG